jgi:hypothetical protein
MTRKLQSSDPVPHAPMAQAPEPEHSGSAGDGNLATPMPLGSFLQGIANIYDLAPRALKRKPKPPKIGVKRTERFSRPIGAALALSVITLVAVGLSSGVTQGVLPSPLRGEWVTENPAYRHRGFIISASELTFRIGAHPDSVTVYPIRAVTQTALDDKTTTFVVDYGIEGETATWKFRYTREGSSSSIRFDNQKDMVWTPVAAPPATAGR